MKIEIRSLCVSLVLLGAALPAAGAAEEALEAYGRLPLSFEANMGQTDPSVRFLGRSQGLTLFFTASEAVLSLGCPAQETAVVRMHPVGGAPRRLLGSAPLPTRSHYFLGNDPSRWHVDVPHYAQVRYESVYPGVDLIYRGNPRQLEYDFVVAPDADPRQIRLAFPGARRMTIGAAGELILHTASGDLVQHAPVIYQQVEEERQRVEGHYVLLEAQGEVGFALGRYDRTRALVIDPVLSYSTFLGGSGQDVADGIAVDGSGNAYLVGFTASTNFPIVSAGSIQPTPGGGTDVFVTKVNAAGTAIVYSTFLGGSGNDVGKAIAVDSAGNAYVTGTTSSNNFPVKGSNSGPVIQGTNAGNGDAFVTRIDGRGNAVLYSTFLGGSGSDLGTGIATDGFGSTYVSGVTQSPSLPGVKQPGSLQGTNAGGGDAFVTRIDAEGSAILYSTFLGGSGSESPEVHIAVGRDQNVYLAGTTSSTTFPGVTASSVQPANQGGNDAWVTRIDSSGTTIVYSTFLGGPGDESGNAIAIDGVGNAYVVGSTSSATFPGVTASSIQPVNGGGGGDAWVTRINPGGTMIIYSTFLGGSALDSATSVALDNEGNACVAGSTSSSGASSSRAFPGVGPASIQPLNAGLSDGFLTRIDPAGTRILDSTFLGGTDNDAIQGIAVDGAGNVYAGGTSSSTAFPGIDAGSIQAVNSGGGDAFVAKISPVQALSCSVPACPQPDTYACCTSEPICRCRPTRLDDADCTAGGKAATGGCSISVK